ncbi:MAG: PEPxxWA-CTERM sorting domain-containing protein [Phenylobacterium sp.]
MKHLLFAAGLSLTALVAAPAGAAIILVDASTIQGANVLFNDGVQTGPTVLGFLQGGTEVVFTGTSGGGTTIRANGGQARIEGALDTTTANPNDTFVLNSLRFQLGGGATFNNLEFNLLGGTATSANFTLVDNVGTTFTFNNRALGNGENFFGFQGINGESIRSVAITLNGGGTGDVRQIRLDQSTAAIPEPATWAMMIVGFGGIGALLRRRAYRGFAVA